MNVNPSLSFYRHLSPKKPKSLNIGAYGHIVIRYNIKLSKKPTATVLSRDYNNMMMMMAEEKNTTDVLENITSGNEAVMHFSEQFRALLTK